LNRNPPKEISVETSVGHEWDGMVVSQGVAVYAACVVFSFMAQT